MVSGTAEHIFAPGREDPSVEVAVHGIFFRGGAVRVAWHHSFDEFIGHKMKWLFQNRIFED
jgi:hypothetical protein